MRMIGMMGIRIIMKMISVRLLTLIHTRLSLNLVGIPRQRVLESLPTGQLRVILGQLFPVRLRI